MYELWDWDAANCINAYPSEAAALHVVADYVTENGQGWVSSWSLLLVVPGSNHEVIAEGDALVALALERAAPRAVAD